MQGVESRVCLSLSDRRQTWLVNAPAVCGGRDDERRCGGSAQEMEAKERVSRDA